MYDMTLYSDPFTFTAKHKTFSSSVNTNLILKSCNKDVLRVVTSKMHTLTHIFYQGVV